MSPAFEYGVIAVVLALPALLGAYGFWDPLEQVYGQLFANVSGVAQGLAR